MTDDIVEKAEDLLERYILRAYDSIQLASAMASNAQFAEVAHENLAFVSADMRLLTAAASEGLTTIDPNTYP